MFSVKLYTSFSNTLPSTRTHYSFTLQPKSHNAYIKITETNLSSQLGFILYQTSFNRNKGHYMCQNILKKYV